jgi:hypothetical protein
MEGSGQLTPPAVRRSWLLWPLVRYPLASFVVIAVAIPALTFVHVGILVSLLTELWAGVAAIIICWASEPTPLLASRRGPRLSLASGAFALGLLAAWLEIGRTAVGTFIGMALPAALAEALILSCLLSPRRAVRELVRPLFRLRAPCRCYSVAVLCWPLVSAGVLLLSRLAPAADPGQSIPAPSTDYDLRVVALSVLGFAVISPGWVVGWYGFAAGRLLRRWSPLAVALLLAILQWVATIAFLLFAWSLSSLWSAPLLITLAQLCAASVVAIWLYLRSEGSLLPLLLTEALAYPAYLAAALYAGTGLARAEAFDYLYRGLQCALAIGLIFSGRMWQRPSPPALTATVVGGPDPAAGTIS